jgi:hypothetical protein
MAKKTIVQVNLLNPTTGEYQETVSPETEGEAVMMATGNNLETDINSLNSQVNSINGFLSSPLTVNVNNTTAAPVNVALPTAAQIKINNTTSAPVPVSLPTTTEVKVNNTTSSPVNVALPAAAAISINNSSNNPVPVTLSEVKVNNTVASPVNVSFPSGAQVKVNNTAADKIPVEIYGGDPAPTFITGQGPDLKVVPNPTALFRSKDTPNAIQTQGTISATTTPVKVGNTMIVAVMLSADPGNVVNIMYGNAAEQPLFLLPGQTVIVPAQEVTLKSATGTATVGWVGIQ